MTTTSTPAPSAHLTRRTLLAATPALAAVAAVPAVAMVAPVDRRAWEHGMAQLARIKAEDAAFRPVYDRVREAWEAGRPSMDGIDFGEFPYLQRDHVARGLDLDAQWRAFTAGEGEWWFAADPEARKAKHRAALDAVQAFRDAEAKNRRDSGMDAADDRFDQLGDAEADAIETLMDTPAPDLAALRWKLETVFGDQKDGSTPCWSAEFVAQTRADVARLLGEPA